MDATQPDAPLDALTVDTAAERILELENPAVEEPTPEPLEETTEEVTEGVEETVEETEESTEEPTEDVTDYTELNDFLVNSREDYDKLLVKTKVNGTEHEVSLKELVDTRQISQAVEERNDALKAKQASFKEESEQARDAFAQRLNNADQLNQALKQEMLKDYEKVNWDELREADPAEFTARRQEFQERQQRVNGVETAINQERQTAINDQYRTLVAEQSVKLAEKFPQWSDESLATKEKQAIRDYVVSQGFTAREVDGTVDESGNIVSVGLIDSRLIEMAHKARLYDEGVKKVETVKKKVKKLPKMAKPGKPETVVEISQQKRDAKRSRLKKSGRLEDAASLIFDTLRS